MNSMMEPSTEDTYAFVLTDAVARTAKFIVVDEFGHEFKIHVNVRLLGEDSGKYVRLNFGGQIANIFEAVQFITRDKSPQKRESRKSKMKRERTESLLKPKRSVRKKVV